MVNTEEFSKRLHTIMEFYDLSASSFSDKIEVGRSSISHILSGRNKPSLEFVMKVVKTFPEVELYWLLNGKGDFPKKELQTHVSAPQQNEEKTQLKENTIKQNQQEEFNFKNLPQNFQKPVAPQIESNSNKAIKKVIIFYEDGTFDAFENGN
ncbi:helix-turn-helix domain-containing protein [Zunongwangia sp.]|uniref:helix-turn-helix domain-containing protein n=1 Tax=Zunongwangia sp. TaxID=1965325 RepID=UPI003AA9DA43